MKRMLSIPLAALLALTLALAACGGNDEDDGGGDDGGQPSGDGAATTITVGLKEFTVEPDKKTAPAGRVTFKAQNKGAIPHELVVIKSDLAADKLPQKDGKLVDESKVQKVGDTGEFDSGKTNDLTLTLQPGKYVLICNVASHYETGMRTDFAVE